MIILKLWTVIATLSIILIIKATLAQNLAAPLFQQVELLSGKIHLTRVLSEGFREHFTTNELLQPPMKAQTFQKVGVSGLELQGQSRSPNVKSILKFNF